MTTIDHYRQAENALSRTRPASPGSQQDLAKAQLHVLLSVADDLRVIRNELTEIRGILARNS
jgi:hypothetical protein